MYKFIINPVSGSGRGIQIWKTVKEELDRQTISYQPYILTRKGEARQLAASISQSHTPCTLVVVGGDGTINETISGLTDTEHITFSCIPTGSGNDFVRGMQMETDPLKALEKILSGAKTVWHSIGDVKPQSISFAVSSGIGFDAAICASVDRSPLKPVLNKIHLGKLVYLITALWQLFTMKCQDLSVSIDGEDPVLYKKCYFAAAMNLPYEGGGFKFCPGANASDDFIDLIIANDIPRLKVLTILPLAFSGKHVGKKGVTIHRCHSAKIDSSEPLYVHTDGEVQGKHASVIYSLRKDKLRTAI